MTKLFTVLGAIISIVVTLFVAVIAGTLIGGVVSWCVNLVFPHVNATLNQISGLSLSAFDTGAVLGFLSGFIKSTNTNSK
jgi:uncharacterized membrane protein YgaE (UPF0421/DUF939 family)